MFHKFQNSLINLNYKKYGEGEPLIILHGFLGSLDNWNTLATEWGKTGFEVYALDMRNHGRSPHTSEHTISLMVEDVRDFISIHKIKKINLLGHSMGGKIAMKFSLDFPDTVEKLIVADISPKEYKRGHDEVFKAIFNLDLQKVKSRKDAVELMKKDLPDESTLQFILKNLERNDDGSYSWKFNIDVLYKNYDEMINGIISEKKFTGKTLFLRGGKSNYIHENDSELIHQFFPNAIIKTIENAGHWVHAEKSDEFSEVVLSFLKS